jgi:hypothetical protein
MKASPDENGPALAVRHDQGCPDQAAERDLWTQYAITIARIHPQNPHPYRESRWSIRQRLQASRSAPLFASRCLREASRAVRDWPHCSALGLRPDEATALQPLGKQAKTIAIPPQQFYDVASAAAEYKDVSGEWLLKKNRLHLRTQTIETSAHVGDAGGDPDLRSCGKLDHLQRLSRMDRTSAGSAPLSTLMIARPANSM